VIVLGIDTATPSTVVGLRLADGTTLQARDDPTAEQRPGHATRLLPLASGLLADAGVAWSAITRIAVGVGPGTFTGLRIGVATAAGLAQSLGVELVGVSSLQALAHAAHVEQPRRSGGLLAVIDARRGELFACAHHGDVELLSPRVLAPTAIEELLGGVAEHTSFAPWIAVGDGALRYRSDFEQANVVVPDDASPLHRIQARAVCDLGEHAPVDDAQVLPHYCRRPDAELTLEGAAS
jgi:tRNA threonylcarbamoyladenosine biosynthesis protein TsaB